MTDTAKPGAMLKALRFKKGWTLAEVAKRTGFTISTLSRMENGKMSLSYDKLARLSKSLDVDIGFFFSETGTTAPPTSSSGRRSVSRAEQGVVIETGVYTYKYKATELLNKSFVPVFAEIHARSRDDFGEMLRHPGEEYTYVLEGTVEIHTDLYEPVRLERGDSIYFDSGMAHAYVAIGDEPCRLLSICSGEESGLMTAHERDAEKSPADQDNAEPKSQMRIRKRIKAA